MAENGTDPKRTSGPAEPVTDPQSGVLGNLPRSRPSVRSPRRGQAVPAGDPIPVEPAQTKAAAGRPDSTEPETDANASPPDLEALARTGIAVAGGAASLGLRIAGRAAAAVRGAVERR